MKSLWKAFFEVRLSAQSDTVTEEEKINENLWWSITASQLSDHKGCQIRWSLSPIYFASLSSLESRQLNKSLQDCRV